MLTRILLAVLIISVQQVCFAQKKKSVNAKTSESKSFYQAGLEDDDAVYFTSESFKITNDGKTDVSDELQRAINEVKTNYNFGIVFIPEGIYKISKTIYIPTAVRVIGYGKKRPEIVLANNAPGFQEEYPQDKGNAKYMFWFTSSIPKEGQPIPDAGASTFYSAMSNVDLRIGAGNPSAVALRTHFAQHSFISHVDIYAGDGKAGMFDVGNEMEDVRFFGGEYGIYTFKPSPGWQFMMVDTYFEGQRKAAIRSQESGLTIVRMTVKNVPTVLEVNPNFYEKLFIEDSRFENISGPALVISNENNAYTQISLRHIDCKKVPVLVSFRESGKQIAGKGELFRIKAFNHGLQMAAIDAKPVHTTTQEIETLKIEPVPAARDIPAFPAMETWVNLKALGAKGDGITDDTKAIQAAIDQHGAIYVPQGWYRITETLKLKEKTMLIGLNPVSTQFILQDNTEAFGSFGPPKPMVESSQGGSNVLTGIGISTAASNTRAVGLKWTAGGNSYVNDVKFLGGHGNIMRKRPGQEVLSNASHVGNEQHWDTQYWSLWITNGGGGTFKNIWTANTFASAGTYVSNTSTPGRIYAMSVEHHVRNEVRFKNVSNWKVYALQLEEESKESSNCQPLEIESCDNMVFANLYMFRVIRVSTPYPHSIRSWNNRKLEFLNVHNYSQTKYPSTVPLFDVNSGLEVRPWEFNRLIIDNPKPKPIDLQPGKVVQLAKGFEFADGICRDSKGNVYFSESRARRIYKWSVETNTLSLVADFPWEPLSLGVDTKDSLLVVFKYVPKQGYIRNGRPETFPNPPDAAGTSFSGWGNNGFGTLVYSINTDKPEETIRRLLWLPLGKKKDIVKTLNPSNRRRDSGDLLKVSTNEFNTCWVAPDLVTIVPEIYDLARSNALVEGYPGKVLYGTDEYLKRTFRFNVGPKGHLSEPQLFAEKGEFSSAVDREGNVYIADGQIYVFDPSGKEINLIETPERPSTIVLAGENGNTLFITGRNGLYAIRVK
ncbi:SMP-30/gluconolactonase/LRE family protein [Dyadobacter sp. CY261]|uniref:glycosyl hydrolase family 28-related protein n=1 Tax=Dyadobacter sp. CY261 TaxID=2907203 RepID=UPI001F1B9E5F|nr:glycosyl hydrolase family 28-related protein [Dyadobacter sp. CY261]MCF0070354.1 SMP-30/gluconolactonase/LRE family protein [Dyadobacter sp. CY261]